jgi:hypothetical protein
MQTPWLLRLRVNSPALAMIGEHCWEGSARRLLLSLLAAERLAPPDFVFAAVPVRIAARWKQRVRLLVKCVRNARNETTCLLQILWRKDLNWLLLYVPCQQFELL